MSAIIKITEPDDGWEGWYFNYPNHQYNSMAYFLVDDEHGDCAACEKITNK